MHRHQHVDLAGFSGFDHPGQITIRIGAGRGRPMHATDKAREAAKAHRIAGDELDPVAGEP
jgi:hypothetical protein